LTNFLVTDTEATELEFIRTTYLPEVILAYHSALYFAGHAIGREILVQCMTLATVVAGSPALTESFMSSGRMAELVDALALSSMAMMDAKEPKMKKKLLQGARLDIWKIKPQEEAEKDV
jgi:nuclear pore complex protein Nup107